LSTKGKTSDIDVFGTCGLLVRNWGKKKRTSQADLVLMTPKKGGEPPEKKKTQSDRFTGDGSALSERKFPCLVGDAGRVLWGWRLSQQKRDKNQ